MEQAPSGGPSPFFDSNPLLLKIATYNVNSIRIRLDAILAWLQKAAPDILCVQETKCQDEEFPLLALSASGYHIRFRGMKSYNGVAVFSREAPSEIAYGFDDGLPENDEARLMRVVIHGVPIINTYVPNGFKIATPKHEYKLQWYGRLRNYFSKNLSADKPAIWCGDMNVAPESIDVHSPEKHLRHVCFHESVRQAYKDTVSWGFVDVFRHLYPDVVQYTFWDYLRPSSVERNKGWRIDHILATRPMLEKCRAAGVDVEPRRQPRASDHTFLWAEFEI
jgi:exodeoxyribonuclease III